MLPIFFWFPKQNFMPKFNKKKSVMYLFHIQIYLLIGIEGRAVGSGGFGDDEHAPVLPIIDKIERAATRHQDFVIFFICGENDHNCKGHSLFKYCIFHGLRTPNEDIQMPKTMQQEHYSVYRAILWRIKMGYKD